MKVCNTQYTSSFYTMNLIPSDYQAVSISIGSPSFYKGKVLECFMPTWGLVNGLRNKTITEEEYRVEYLNLLGCRMEKIRIVIEEIKNEKNVFLCHDPKGAFCHRHIVSELLNSLGIECYEL